MSGRSPCAAWWGTYALTAGALSVGLDAAGYEVLSRVALAVAGAAWLASAAGLVLRLSPARARWRAETPGALVTVAATAVLGTGLCAAGSQPPAAALLALAAPLWAVLLTVEGEERRGTVFLRCVATQGLVVLGATLAAAESAVWLVHAALVLFWLGIALYCLALVRFEPRQVAEGAGDHWLAGGALAVSALAGAKLLDADSAHLYLWNDDGQGVLSRVTVALLVLGLAGYAALLVAEFVWPRRRYDVRRWATVFSAAVTAAATLAVATALDVPWLEGLGLALLWVAVAAWLGGSAWAIASARAGAGPGRVRSRARR